MLKVEYLSDTDDVRRVLGFDVALSPVVVASVELDEEERVEVVTAGLSAVVVAVEEVDVEVNALPDVVLSYMVLRRAPGLLVLGQRWWKAVNWAWELPATIIVLRTHSALSLDEVKPTQL